MKVSAIIFILFWSSGMLWAQENRIANLPSTGAVQSYFSKTKEYAALYNGKVITPYDRRFTNHPCFETNSYVAGTLCYNHVVYSDVLMRFDLYRDELTVISPDVPHRIVLNNEKFNYAVLNGSTIIKSVDEKTSKVKFLVLLHTGICPVVKKHRISIVEKHEERILTNTFNIQNQYAIYKDGIPYAVKNKNSILKLFPDRKKELNEFARQHKLNFKSQIEQSIIDMVTHYENLTSQRHADETDLRR